MHLFIVRFNFTHIHVPGSSLCTSPNLNRLNKLLPGSSSPHLRHYTARSLILVHPPSAHTRAPFPSTSKARKVNATCGTRYFLFPSHAGLTLPTTSDAFIRPRPARTSHVPLLMSHAARCMPHDFPTPWYPVDAGYFRFCTRFPPSLAFLVSAHYYPREVRPSHTLTPLTYSNSPFTSLALLIYTSEFCFY